MLSRARVTDYYWALALHGYASSTPVADDSGVYVFYGTTGVAAYDHSGKLKWEKSCGTRYDAYGSASSPILYGDLLIVQANAVAEKVIAFDKRTGREVWHVATSGDKQYTPSIVRRDQGDELIFYEKKGKFAAADPATGRLLWHCSSPEGYMNPIPLVHNDIVYAAGGINQMFAVRAGGRGDVNDSHVLWRIGSSISNVSTVVFHDGYLYGSQNNQGVVTCIDIKTGKRAYNGRLQPSSGVMYASPILAAERLYYVSREKGVYVVAAKPQFELLAHNVIETDDSIFNGTPAVSDGRLYLRSDKCLYCIGEK